MFVNVEQQELGKDLPVKRTQSSVRGPRRKAPGTRIGLLIDWREGSAKVSGRHGRAFRDGR